MIIQITGHTSEQNFLRYINISQEEAVEEFRKHKFFHEEMDVIVICK